LGRRAEGRGLGARLVRHKFLLHEQPVLNAFQFELAQHAFGRGRHVGQPVLPVQPLFLHLSGFGSRFEGFRVRV